MKIVFLNIFKGCFEEERLRRIKSFVMKERPDFLILSEVYNWKSENKKKINEFKDSLGYSYDQVLGNEIAILSNFEFTSSVLSRATLKIDFFHKTPISIIATHLYYLNEYIRTNEIRTILENINLNEKVILVGDLNSLSPLDDYDEELLIEIFRKNNLTKFGVDKLEKEVQQKILDFGLIDTVKKFSDYFEYSVPTDFNMDPAHAAKLRLDYLYVTPPLMPHLKSSKIIRTPETNKLSDHFPIVAEFDL